MKTGCRISTAAQNLKRISPRLLQPSSAISLSNPIAGDRFCPAQPLRLDRTKPLICSAVELVPFQASLERNFKQSSPSAFGGSHLFGKYGTLACAIRDAEAVTLLRAAAQKKWGRRRVAHRPVALPENTALPRERSESRHVWCGRVRYRPFKTACKPIRNETPLLPLLYPIHRAFL